MTKNKFVGEYGINASKKMLYPYISQASGLAQWFADDVNINEDKVFTFIWDGEENKAKLVSSRANHHVKFEFLESLVSCHKSSFGESVPCVDDTWIVTSYPYSQCSTVQKAA